MLDSLSDFIHSAGSTATIFSSVGTAFATALLLLIIALHEFVEILIGHVISLLLDFLLKLIDGVHVLLLLLMLGFLFEIFQGLVELFVLITLFLFFEGLDSDLLFEQATLHLYHVEVCFEHFCEEIVGSRNGYTRLNKELHSLHYVCAR